MVAASNPCFFPSGLVSRGMSDFLVLTFPSSAPRPRISPSASYAPPEPRGEGKSLEIKGLDGSTFELQVGDDATVEDVYKYTSEKIGLKPGKKLLLTSGCTILDYSRPLLQQAEGVEISFVVQQISLKDFAKIFWNAMRTQTKESLTAEDVKTLHAAAIASIHFGATFNQSLADVTLPSSLQTLTFGDWFNQSLSGVTLPSSLQTLTFGGSLVKVSQVILQRPFDF